MKKILLTILLLISCDGIEETFEEPHWEYAGRAHWQLHHEDGQAVARVIVEMTAYNGIAENVWFYGKLMDGETYETISMDSVYIGYFDTVFDTVFSIYKQYGYSNRPISARWSMWAKIKQRN